MKRPYLIVNNDLPQSTAVCVVGLDNITQITSAYGSQAAGAALGEFEHRLSELVRPSDALIEIAQAKYCITFHGLSGDNHAFLAGAKLERLFSEPMRHEGRQIDLVVHAGFACASDSAANAEALFRAAETTREAAISEHKTFDVAESDRVRQLQNDWTINEQIDTALVNHELTLFYQPKVSAITGSSAGAEGLVRWPTPDGTRNPADFVSLLDDERMSEMTRYCLRQAIRDMSRHPSMTNVSVNVDTSVLREMDLVTFVADELALWGVESKRLTVEVTQTGIVGNYDAIQPTLRSLRSMGTRVALDDFGVGYSSLAQFKMLPIDEMKIDRSFVTAVTRSDADRYLTQMSVDLGHHFGVSVVAEGIEDVETETALTQMGCDVLQGFWVSAPLPLNDYIDWLDSR